MREAISTSIAFSRIQLQQRRATFVKHNIIKGLTKRWSEPPPVVTFAF